MKNMKKTVGFFAGLAMLCYGSLALAEETSKPVDSVQYGYVDLGVGPAPLPLPWFGAGYRAQSGASGFDANVQVSTIVVATALKFNANYLHYFNPNAASEFYIGAGPALALVLSDSGDHSETLIAPNFVFGKQYFSEGMPRHFQADVVWPIYLLGNHPEVTKYPVVTLSYGWGF